MDFNNHILKQFNERRNILRESVAYLQCNVCASVWVRVRVYERERHLIINAKVECLPRMSVYLLLYLCPILENDGL